MTLRTGHDTSSWRGVPSWHSSLRSHSLTPRRCMRSSAVPVLLLDRTSEGIDTRRIKLLIARRRARHADFPTAWPLLHALQRTGMDENYECAILLMGR